MLKVDTHCHLSSEGLANAISQYTPYRLVVDRKNKTLNTALAEKMNLLNEDERIAEMDELGIDINVISVGAYILFSEQQLTASPRIRLNISQVINDYLASICQRYPQRFMAFADIPLTLGEPAIKEMIRSRDDLHLQGIGLVTNFFGKYLDAPEFTPFFEEANRRKVTALVHPFNPPSLQPALRDLDMYRVIGFPADTTLTFCRMAYSGFLEKYPNINFILSHVGGTIPFLWPRIDITYRKRTFGGNDLPHPPTHYLEKCYYDTALTDTKSLMLAYARLGDHMVLGTDYAFGKELVTHTLAVVEGMDVPDAVKSKIFGETALSLLR